MMEKGDQDANVLLRYIEDTESYSMATTKDKQTTLQNSISPQRTVFQEWGHPTHLTARTCQ